MNLVRKLLLNLAGGVEKKRYDKVEYTKDKHNKELLLVKTQLHKIRTSISFGAQCPMCYRTYEIHIDITQPLKDKRQPAKGVHCPHCRHKHPMMWWYSKFEITSVKEVDAKKINE